MILLNSGADSNSAQNIEQLNRKHGGFKIIKKLLLLFVFIVLLGATFWSVQWFANSVQGFFFFNQPQNNNLFSGSLQTSAAQTIELGAQVQQPSAVLELLLSSGGGMPENPAPVQNVPVSPLAVISVKVTGEEEELVFAKNENQELPVASLTKLMTALTALGHYSMSDHITINEGAMKQEGEQGSLKLGQTLSVKDLLYITLIESSNKAAFALASRMGNFKFVDAMNARAQELGLSGTYFVDSTGIRSGSRSTAADIAKLARHLYENYPLFKEIISLREFDLYLEDGTFHHKLVNTNKLLGEVAGIVGGKTGWTNEAKGCLMVIEDRQEGGEYVIHVVLGSQDRFEDAKKLIHD